MTKVDNTKAKGQKNTKQMLVRYGRLGQLGWFEHHESHIPRLNAHVIIKTERGLELGEIVGIHSYRGGQFKSSPEQVEQYFCNRTKDYPLGEGGDFVRFATHDDLREQEHLEKNSIGEAKTCQRIAEELGLKMRVIEGEHIFGGERIIFYFTSENRIDFRELVKRLAREYQTRIELRQIGSRDEARLISDYESCGQQCCCSRFLKILEPVNMRMAKLQKATLDPSKISGHCGRLKCCLRYEDENYLELKRKLPNRNATVQTPKGVGKVVDVQVLTQLVVVQTESGDRHAWPLDEIKKVDPSEARQKDTSGKNETEEGGADASFSLLEDAVVTEELVEMAESEQEMLEAQPHQQPTPGKGGDSSGQPKTSDASGQEGRRKKKRRRRSKNKKRGPKDGPNSQNSQNNQNTKQSAPNEGKPKSTGE
ncbi:MAG: regulatory iron-sulfur-containing complex subunit RicT [Phycisphaerae bacterium]|nr:regulatory iron-sulfur-containing complex subunit RicT [Phycisphaerae bacterium]